jgi:hypothetical protein
MLTPAEIILGIMSSVQEAGPMVATIYQEEDADQMDPKHKRFRANEF